MKGVRVTDITIHGDNNLSRKITKDDFADMVRKEYTHLLPENEIDKDKMYELIGFSLAVLHRCMNP